MATTNKPNAIITSQNGVAHSGIIIFQTTTFVVLKELENDIETTNYYYFPLNVTILEYPQ
jgi:hypothetical protein